MQETRRGWAVRQVVREILVKHLDSIKSASQVSPTCLWGEVIEVRKKPAPQVLLRDKKNAGQRILATLPGHVPLPSVGDMVCVEGVLQAKLDEGTCSVSLRFEGESIVENKGPSARIRAQRKALDEIEQRYPARPKIDRAIRKIAVVSSERSKGRGDFEKILEGRIKYGLNTIFVPVSLQDAGSIAEGIRKAGRSGADMVVVTRGGGSVSELCLFDEPVVAEALASLSQPALVGVGHAGDEVEAHRFAAYKASTPSEAAAMVARLYYDHLETRPPARPAPTALPPAPLLFEAKRPTNSIALAPNSTASPQRAATQIATTRSRAPSLSRILVTVVIMAVAIAAGWTVGASLFNRMVEEDPTGMHAGRETTSAAPNKTEGQPKVPRVPGAQQRTRKSQTNSTTKSPSAVQGIKPAPTAEKAESTPSAGANQHAPSLQPNPGFPLPQNQPE